MQKKEALELIKYNKNLHVVIQTHRQMNFTDP